MISSDQAGTAILCRITGTQARLWLYLLMIDRFADRTLDGDRIYHDIPSPVEIALKIGASPRTVEKDMLRLQQMGLYEFRVKEWQGYNLTQQKAREASEELKQAKAERKRHKLAQNKDGYLAENPAILPEPALNSRDGGYLAENEIPESLLSKAFRDFESASDLQTFSDLDQNLKEREKNKRNQTNKSEDEVSKPLLSVEIAGSSQVSVRSAININWENFSAPGDDPDFFEFVVNKATKFKNPVPADVRCAAEGWIRKQWYILYPQYLQWKEAQRQADQRLASAAVEVAPPPQAELESESVEQRLQRYQMLWRTPVCRKGIKEMIANHPEWGLAICSNGPQWAEVTVEVPVAKVPTVVPSQSWVPEPVLDHRDVIPDDVSDVLVEIDLHLRRLGWDAEQVKGHLQQTYGKRSRQMLSGQELIHFLECLQAQNQ